MALLGSLVGKLIAVVVLLVVLLLVVGVGAYAADYGAEATVVEKDCSGPTPSVTVRPKLLAFMTQDVEIDSSQCSVLSPGNFVVYHLRSGRAVIYQAEGGDCLYDTARFPLGCGG